MTEIDNKQINLALGMMLGFKIGKWDTIDNLISSIGLTKKEWIHIKKCEDSGQLDEEDVKLIDEILL